MTGLLGGLRGAKTRLALAALFFVVSGLLLVGAAWAARPEKVDQLSPQGYVNDFAGVLDDASKQTLTALCQEVDSKADAQIAVVTIKSLEGDSVDDFTINLAEKWGVGPKQKDRGVMILLAVQDHQYRTEVGYGLEPILTDGMVGGFGRQMVSLLRQNQYGPALVQITSQIANVIAKDKGVSLSQPAAAPAAPADQPDEQGPFGIPPILFFWLIILVLFGGWRLITWVLILMGLMSPRPRSRGTWMGGGPMVGGWGGGGFGGGGASGGFGGFGGGGFGGGGASGGW